MNSQPSFRALTFGLIASMAVLFAGCQSSLSTMNMNPFESQAESKPVFSQPARMAVIWKETAVSPPGRESTRGFGGRVYFYDADNEPIRANGELTVYAFDDSNQAGQPGNIPERKYVFRGDDLQRHFGETDIGPSYSVWLPWDKVGGDRKTISLVPVFKPVEGSIVQSDQSIAVLPGKVPGDQIVELENADALVRQVAMTVPPGESSRAAKLAVNEAVGTGVSSSKNRIRSTTINVPRSLANRMNQANRPYRPMVQSSASMTNETPRESASTVEPVQASSRQRPQGTANRRPNTFGQPGSMR